MTQEGPLILVVEDEAALRRFLRAALTSHGFRLEEAETGAAALRSLTTHPPDLVILDLGLPDVDGIALTRDIRGWSAVPIVVVSARGREDDKVAALDAGADDYVTKPFGVAELLARIRVALRHARSATALEADDAPLAVGPIRIDPDRHRVTVAEREVRLTPTEYRLLWLLAKNAGKVLTHRQILREVWGPEHASDTHYVRVHMAELRKKIEVDPAHPRWLVTEPAVGYRLREGGA
ncbi:MAG: response regulator [Polyangiaceae bacterium]|nr:response regulator [Polyangiaceae bacterium]MBK8940255.1 response regulator [Polyangiaceae bacterium]